MHTLATTNTDKPKPVSPVVALLDRVWRMHPAVNAGSLISYALEVQVGYLAELPVSTGWMMRYLRDLPTFVPTDAPAPTIIDDIAQDDVRYCLGLRASSHRDNVEGVYDDALDICQVALRLLTPGTVCRISVKSYEKTRKLNDPQEGKS